MTMRFPYRLLNSPHPIVSLGGQMQRPRSMVPFALVGPTSTVARDGLLDTGADDTVFPETIAEKAGIDLSNAPAGEAVGVGGAPVSVRFAQVTLRVSDGQEHRSWLAWVGFAAAGL